MNVISIKDYAKQRNVSYEAIRQQVVRYAAELDGHIVKDGRQQFLDDEAVAFLDAKRKKNPVVLYQVEKDEEIERLKAEKERILLELAGVQKQLIQEQQKNALLIEENSKIALLQADNDAARKVAEQAAEEEKRKATKAEKEKKEAEERAVAAELALTDTKEQLQNVSDIAEINAQERDQERRRAEEAERTASDLKTENDAVWKHIERIKNRGLIERLFNKNLD